MNPEPPQPDEEDAGSGAGQQPSGRPPASSDLDQTWRLPPGSGPGPAEDAPTVIAPRPDAGASGPAEDEDQGEAGWDERSAPGAEVASGGWGGFSDTAGGTGQPGSPSAWPEPGEAGPGGSPSAWPEPGAAGPGGSPSAWPEPSRACRGAG